MYLKYQHIKFPKCCQIIDLQLLEAGAGLCMRLTLLLFLREGKTSGHSVCLLTLKGDFTLSGSSAEDMAELITMFLSGLTERSKYAVQYRAGLAAAVALLWPFSTQPVSSEARSEISGVSPPRAPGLRLSAAAAELTKYLRGYHVCTKEEMVNIAALLFRVKVSGDKNQIAMIPKVLKELVPGDQLKAMSENEWKKVQILRGRGWQEFCGLCFLID
ncbi:hypothetical protein XENOCAPTIV_018936 [Xenoophorus captivus]|uniref:Myosin VII FERM domain-containing protein n=1 Tax=Xenoophorus captivus TaxID=1517983 RepID=A0ABV0RWK3_9TELE